MPTMTIKIKVPVRFYKEDDVFVSFCPVFDIASQGCTEEEAKENITEAVRLFIETCIEMGTIKQVMQDCGFSKSAGIVEEENGENNLDITLPYISSKRLMECRA